MPDVDDAGATGDASDEVVADPTRPADGPAQVFLAIAALTGLVFAQPVLDLLGNSPSTFRFREISGWPIAWFAVAVVVVPPLILWSIAEIARRVRADVGRVTEMTIIAALFGLLGLLVSKEFTEVAVLNLLAGLAAAAGGAAAYAKLAPARQWLRLLVVANLVFLGQFVFVSPASDLIDVARDAPAEASFAADALDESGDPASLVMIVLDELATQSVITDGGGIDPVRFPNLAAFATESTWYRHFSTVSPFTQSAVPALLDGLDPTGEPTLADHPDNLFGLLAASHDLQAAEALTSLCGFKACGSSPSPPQWRALVDDTVAVWAERVLPGQADPAGGYDDFEEQLDPAGTAEAQDSPRLNGLTEEDLAALDVLFNTEVAAQPGRHQDFVESLQPSSDPFFAFLHLVLPHQPWLARADGTTYDLPGEDDTNPDVSTEWRARVTRQRQFLQAEYTDRLVGLVLERLRDIDEYDDALVVVVSDHGVAFTPGQPTRSLTDENIEQVAYSPLLVKAPGQRRGKVDDSNLVSVDVAPTVAEILGTELDWTHAGGAAGSDTVAARGDEKYIYSYTDAFTYEFLGIEQFADSQAFATMFEGRYPAISADESRLAGLYAGQAGAEFIGRSDSVIREADGVEVEVRELASLRAPPGPTLLAEVSGRVPSADPGDSVVVAVNGVVVGVSPLYDDDGGANTFVVLLPDLALDADRNEVRFGLLRAGQAAPDEMQPVDGG